ncbi:MAG: SUF system NifU family Fe-S cluster assembly protein [Gammaproteobacteria bacterium]|nr:SUF system NifU family Fe-S cluster assembly protein [Gammaproteobacteria bacterium]
MFDLKDLYQEVIVDHNRSPRNFGKLAGADRMLEGFNPLCGDRLTLYLKLADGRIADISFDGTGCAISIASASLMTDAMKGKTTAEAETIFNQFHELVTATRADPDLEKFGKLAALAGVREYPTRVKCATLCWHTLHTALTSDQTTVTTE